MIFLYVISNITYMKSNNAKKLGEHIRKLRLKNGESLNSFVLKNSSITPATWSRIENAKTDVKFSTLVEIARNFKMTLSELLKDVDIDYEEKDI